MSTDCGGMSTIAIVLLASLALALPIIFNVLPLFAVSALAWSGLGIYQVSTAEAASLCWILGWVALMVGLFSVFEFVRRTMLNRTAKPTNEDEMDAYRKRLDRIQRRGR